jgi:hypothetical protein
LHCARHAQQAQIASFAGSARFLADKDVLLFLQIDKQVFHQRLRIPFELLARLNDGNIVLERRAVRQLISSDEGAKAAKDVLGSLSGSGYFLAASDLPNFAALNSQRM